MLRQCRNLLFSTLVTLCAANVQAAPITQSAYHYEFDIVSSNIYHHSNVVWNSTTDEEIDDPVLAQALTENIHPLREAIGLTGRMVIELAYVENIVTYTRSDGSIGSTSDDEWTQVDCVSGFLCDLGYIISGRYTPYISSFPTENLFSIAPSGDIFWYANLNGSGGGTLNYSGDDYHAGDNYYELNGNRYYPTSDGNASFQLANVQVTRLDALVSDPPVSAPPLNTPLPAPALMLLTALGGGTLLARRSRRGRQATDALNVKNRL